MKTTTTYHRPIHAIADEIIKDWTKPYFGAVPYLGAMRFLHTMKDSYGYDDARTVILYFMANATTWRGEKAREIKAELKALTARR